MQVLRCRLITVIRQKAQYTGHVSLYLPNATMYGQELNFPYKFGISIISLFWCYIGFLAG